MKIHSSCKIEYIVETHLLQAEPFYGSPPNFFLPKSPVSKPALSRISWNTISFNTPTSSIVRHLHTSIYLPVAPLAYQVILEPGIDQFREFEPRRVHSRIHSLGLFLVHNWLAECARAWVSNTRWKIDEQWDCWTLCTIKIEGKTGGETGRHLWPRHVQKPEGKKVWEEKKKHTQENIWILVFQ